MYIFEINPLSVASFAIIFSQSEGCLYTLLIVSFAVQKLLSFIRSHLFITMVLICLSLMANDVKYLFMYVFSLLMSFSVKYLFESLTHF